MGWTSTLHLGRALSTCSSWQHTPHPPLPNHLGQQPSLRTVLGEGTGHSGITWVWVPAHPHGSTEWWMWQCQLSSRLSHSCAGHLGNEPWVRIPLQVSSRNNNKGIALTQIQALPHKSPISLLSKIKKFLQQPQNSIQRFLSEGLPNHPAGNHNPYHETLSFLIALFFFFLLFF